MSTKPFKATFTRHAQPSLRAPRCSDARRDRAPASPEGDEEATKFVNSFHEKFPGKSGPVEAFTGLRITRDNDVTTLSQVPYVESIIQRFNMATANHTRAPLNSGFCITDVDIPTAAAEIAVARSKPILALLGSMNYATHSRWDIIPSLQDREGGRVTTSRTPPTQKGRSSMLDLEFDHFPKF